MLSRKPGNVYIGAEVAITEAKLRMFPDAISTALELVGLTGGSDESINLLMWLYRGAGLQDRMVVDLQRDKHINKLMDYQSARNTLTP